MYQPLIPRGERSGLLTRIGTMENVSLCGRMKSLMAFSHGKRSTFVRSRPRTVREQIVDNSALFVLDPAITRMT